MTFHAKIDMPPPLAGTHEPDAESGFTRRAVLGALASVSALALAAAAAALAAPAVAAAIGANPEEPDAEILGLGAEIVRRCAESDKREAERVLPLEAVFQEILKEAGRPFEARMADAWKFSDASGRTAAIDEIEEFDLVTDVLFDRMMAIPAETQQGRAAKVRGLLVHVMCTGWRGPNEQLDWPQRMVRALLGEFAGLSVEQVEAI